MSITLKAARVNAGLSREDAARKIGVSKDTISKWERGQSFPNTKYIPQIEKAYNLEYKDLSLLPS